MAEAGAALGILKCAGSVIPQLIPQEIKDKLTRPVSYVIFYGSNAADVPKKIEQLKSVKVEVQARWLIAETNGEQIRHMIQDWLDATNEIIKKFDSMESNNCFGGSCEIGKMLDEVKKMMNESQHFQWVSYPGDPPQVGSRYRSYNKSLLSREKVLVDIFKALKDSKFNMISVCGIPGVGKTTLLEELVKRVEADGLFHIIAKVDVSQALDIKMIQASIATRIQLDLPQQGDEETRANLLYRQLEARLSNKESKILLIFDDICTEDEKILERIGIPFLPEGEASCTILVSSRSSDLYKIVGGNCKFQFQVVCLDSAEAKILFRDRLGNKISNEEYKSRKYISMENDLLDKCGGLPRAITTLAEVLKVSWPDWDDVVDQLRNHNLSEVDGVMNTLHQPVKLSYDLLESDKKKNFFLLCCLFQPGTSIATEDLMRCGIGLNLFGKIISLEDVTQRANMWINRLKSLSLFESSDDQGSISVHNIIREFAISIALEGEYMLLLDDGAQWETKENWKKYNILSVKCNANDFEHLDGLELPKLEALFLKGESSNLRNGFFKGMKNLRVLGMTKMKLSALPQSMEHLKNLITLSLEYCVIEDASLISSILVSLKVLSFRGSTIVAFPKHIGQLGDLRLLDLTRCCFRTILDDVVSSLSQLEGLYMCDTDGVITESLVGGLKSFERLNVLEIEIPSTYLESVGDLSLGCTPLRFKIAVGCKVLSPYIEFSIFKRVLLLKEIDARMLRKQGLRDLVKRAECLSLFEIMNLRKVVYDLDEDGLADLNCLQISHCNQMECLVNTMGMPAEFKVLPQLEILNLEHLDSLKVIFHGRNSQNWCSKLRELKLSYLRELSPHVLPIYYANKLADVEVRDCAGLEHIFSTIKSSEINVNAECYDFPCLKKLDLQRLPRLQALWAGETTTSDLTYHPLFHEKMNFPSLDELYLSSLDNIEELWELSPSVSASAKETFSKLHILILDNMPNLKHVWNKELCEGSLSFGSLKKVNIIGCGLLESLCPPTIPGFLSKLDSLEIVACDHLEQVIMTETEADNIIEFPSLQRLKLKELLSLRCFCRGTYTIKFPSLKVLCLSSLPKVLTFLEPKNSGTSSCSLAKGDAQNVQESSNSYMKRTLFIGEIVFPSLENLELSAMEDIEELVEEEHAANAFPKLKALTINGLCKLKIIPETILNELEQLKIQDCHSLHGLFEVKSTPSIMSLRNLELVDVRCLRHIPWNLLPNLHSLIIHGGFLGMESMVSSTAIFQGDVLHKLEFINIEQCEHLKEIVSKEFDHEQKLLENGSFMFPRLKHVKLHRLPNIATFSSGSYEATFPALEKVEISGCPSLGSFTLGTIVLTPKMKDLQVDQVTVLEPMDLNHFLGNQKQGCSEQGEVSLQSPPSTLEKTRISDNEAATKILSRVYENSRIASNQGYQNPRIGLLRDFRIES